MNYLLNLAIAFDQFANAALDGSPDETLSARAWRTEQTGKIFGRAFRPLIDALFLLFLQRNHCQSSYREERLRKQLPSEYQ